MCLFVGIFSFYPGQVNENARFPRKLAGKVNLLDNGERTLAFPVFRTVKPSFNQQPASKLSISGKSRKLDAQEAREKRRGSSRLRRSIARSRAALLPRPNWRACSQVINL